MNRLGLRLYSIHLPGPYSAPNAEPEALREGFSLLAFVLTLAWALAKGLWIKAGVLAAILGVLGGLAAFAGLNGPGLGILILAVMVWVGMEANDWRRAALAKRGWREVCVIAAENQDSALRRYGDLASLGPTTNPGDAALSPSPSPSLGGPASA